MEEPGQHPWQNTVPAGERKKHDTEQHRPGQRKVPPGIQFGIGRGQTRLNQFTSPAGESEHQNKVWVGPGIVVTY